MKTFNKTTRRAIIHFLKVSLFLLILTNVSCKDEKNCEYEEVACGGSATTPMVDLIVLIDTSGSMYTSASSVSTEATAALELAIQTCDSDLRVTYLGVDGVIAATNFTTSHRAYLTSLHGASVVLAADQNHVGYSSEQGANAIEDLSKYFDWRENACRSIFYISDEELDGSSPRADYLNEDAATADAISEAQDNNVAVFANYLTNQLLGPSILTNYTDLTSQTNGLLFTTGSNPLPANYYIDNDVFTEIVCNSCNGCE